MIPTILDLLLQHGADINADNSMGMTPIMFAAMFGRTRVVEQLRAHGGSLKCRNRVGHTTWSPPFPSTAGAASSPSAPPRSN
jgi:ankyrin repeat protein